MIMLRNIPPGAAGPIRGVALALAMALAPGLALAQAGISFGDLRPEEGAPLEITSDRLDVNQTQGTARFTGDVVVAQGELRLAAAAVEAHYAAGEEGASGRISRLEASGGVLISAGGAGIEAAGAVYDLDAGTVVLSGDVVLTQAGNTVAGQRLVIDVASGTGRMEGRVRTVLQTRGAPR